MSHDVHYVTEVATCHSELSPHFAAWQKLVQRSLEENVYLQPEFLIPAFEFRQFNGVPFAVFIYEVHKHERRLALVAVFEKYQSSVRMPFAHLHASAGRHGYLVRPMLQRENAVAAVQALLQWLARGDQDWKAVIFRHLCPQSPVGRLLLEQLASHDNSNIRYPTFKRAVFEEVDSFDDFLSSLSSKRRKSLRRYRRKLDGAGNLEIECRVNDEVGSDFADRFATMERKTWKGAESTALASSESAYAFLRALTDNFAAQRAFYSCDVKLDGQSIAMSHNLLGSETMFAFKIAFDEEYRQYSPGILLATEIIRCLLDDGINKADGGNAGDSFVTELWPKLLQFENVFMPVSLSSRLYGKMAHHAITYKHRGDKASPGVGG
jgi:hypothetical protein